MKPTTSEWMEIRSSKIHSKGGFAKKNIPKGTKVIEYVGEKVTKAEGERRADRDIDLNSKNSVKGAVYLFTLNKRYDIDGNVPWNTAKYINHSCDPNCEVDIIKGHIWIMALKDIKKGEELTYNYSYEWDTELHECKCGSKRCVGYILDEDDWPKLKRKLKKDAAKKN